MTDPYQLSLLKAEQLAEAAQQQALDATEAQPWRTTALHWLLAQPVGSTITADDLVNSIGLPDEGVYRNNAVGGFFAAQHKQGRIRFGGRYRKSERVIGHGNLQRVWERTGLDNRLEPE